MAILTKQRFNAILSTLMRFLAMAPGRQKVHYPTRKICRLFQYFCTFLSAFYKEAHVLEVSRRNSIAQILAKIDGVAVCMGMTRKILRFGPSISCIRNFILALQSLVKRDYKEETNIFLMKGLSNLFIAGYFVFDHYLWLEKVGIANYPAVKARFQFLATLSWLLDCIVGLVKNICALYNEQFSTKKIREVGVDLVKYACDLPVAIYFLYPGTVNGKVAGLLGTFTSILGIYQMLH